METLPIPTAIPPFYATNEINRSLDLYEGSLEVTTADGTFQGTGTIKQQWLPEPSIDIKCQYNGIKPNKPEAEIGLPGVQQRFTLSVTSYGYGVKGSESFATLSGQPNGMVCGSGDSIAKLRFHVPNFSWFRGARVQDADEDSPREGRATFSVEDWALVIDSVPGFKFGSDFNIEDQSGNAITHVGELVKQDGSSFAVSSTDSILLQINQWLSFCRGNWVAPILSVGFDDSGQVVWKDWRQWNFRHGERIPTWLNRNSAESLEQSFPGFCARYKDVIWAGPIKRVLAWYVECNRRASGLEASIILCQTALELLGWASLAQDNKVLSQKGFQDLPAADKIRLLLASFKIPLTIPIYLNELRQLAKAYTWSDGPECLVGTRNALVHPQPKKMLKLERVSSVAFFEIWSLGMWYLDLILLRLFNYNAVYRNRLKRLCPYDDTLEPLPWIK
jgi:hypothetical protein